MAEKLRLIKKTIQHSEARQLSQICGVHASVISTYLTHGNRMVLNKRRVEKIISAWKKIEDDKIRNYYE